jgi:hypothetical protein
MFTMFLISSAAMAIGIIGSFVIWRLDARRADEIEQMPARVGPTALTVDAAKPLTAIRPS